MAVNRKEDPEKAVKRFQKSKEAAAKMSSGKHMKVADNRTIGTQSQLNDNTEKGWTGRDPSPQSLTVQDLRKIKLQTR